MSSLSFASASSTPLSPLKLLLVLTICVSNTCWIHYRRSTVGRDHSSQLQPLSLSLSAASFILTISAIFVILPSRHSSPLESVLHFRTETAVFHAICTNLDRTNRIQPDHIVLPVRDCPTSFATTVVEPRSHHHLYAFCSHFHNPCEDLHYTFHSACLGSLENIVKHLHRDGQEPRYYSVPARLQDALTCNLAHTI